jgi:integrase
MTSVRLIDQPSGRAWAITPTRRHASRNPLRLIELPPNDEKPRLRVAFAPEAEMLLNALEPEDALPSAIAFDAGLRRSQIHRLEWPDVLAGRKIASRLLVARAKSAAGTERPRRSRIPSGTSSVELGSGALHPHDARRLGLGAI